MNGITPALAGMIDQNRRLVMNITSKVTDSGMVICRKSGRIKSPIVLIGGATKWWVNINCFDPVILICVDYWINNLIKIKREIHFLHVFFVKRTNKSNLKLVYYCLQIFRQKCNIDKLSNFLTTSGIFFWY